MKSARTGWSRWRTSWRTAFWQATASARPGQIDHDAAPVSAFRAQGHGDTAAARAQIRKIDGAVAAFEGRFDEVLGFRAGNEGGGRDPEVPAVEFALAEKVGGGFAIGSAAEQAGHAGELIAGEEGFRMGGEFHTADAADVLEDEFGGQARPSPPRPHATYGSLRGPSRLGKVQAWVILWV